MPCLARLLIIFLLATSVAATGLPDPRPDHALVMARFAKDCMKRMRELTKQLEATLGPDTGDLSMRIGMYHL